jgi:hypothetical protein
MKAVSFCRYFDEIFSVRKNCGVEIVKLFLILRASGSGSCTEKSDFIKFNIYFLTPSRKLFDI